jgi:hypothetical protein
MTVELDQGITSDPWDWRGGDTLREECGVFGVFGHDDAAALTALGLHALQHRGQEATGVVASAYHALVPGLDELLSWQNGFYAYRRGLHLFGSCVAPQFHSLEAWNAPDGWVGDYGDLARGLFFFAEDSFGDQFAWDGEKVVRFLAETGKREEFSQGLGDCLQRIAKNPDEELGLGVLRDWIARKGAVQEGAHLFPRTPLVTRGSLDPSEVVVIDPFENMRFKASLARQIADVPDGGRIELIVGSPPVKRST